MEEKFIWHPDFYKPSYDDLIDLMLLHYLNGNSMKLFIVIKKLTHNGNESIVISSHSLAKMASISYTKAQKGKQRLGILPLIDFKIIECENRGRNGVRIVLNPIEKWIKPKELINIDRTKLVQNESDYKNKLINGNL